jgi:hypothetical protein
MKQEELKGDQHKIDANKNGEIDAHDFHLLRKQKTEKNESWDSKKSAVSEQRLEEGKQKFSNSKLQELVAKLSHHVRQLDAAGSRGEYSVSSNLLEQAVDAIQGMMQHKKQKLSNSRLLELITKCRARARQLDSAGSRGEYSVTSGLLEQAANAIQAMMQDKKITEANDELIEGIFSTKKSRIHKSIGQHVDDHLEAIAKGKSSEPLHKALPEIHKKIADSHGISHDEAKKHVASYIEKKSDDIYWRNRDAVAPGHPGAGAGY